MSKSRRRSLPFLALSAVAAVYLGLMVLLAGCQKRYIYYPQREAESALLQQASRMGLEPWRDGNDELIGWVASAPQGEGPLRRVAVFHGNAGMALHRSHYAQAFQHLPGRWEVRLFEYPGYGSRSGSPGEAVFYEGARQALRQLDQPEQRSLFLLGESLGTGVASRMAAEFPEEVSGLILITPFTDLADVGARHFRGFPVRLLLRERYDNTGSLEEYGGRVAIVLAEHDEVIPSDIGRRLFEEYEGPKKLWVQEGATHNTLDLGPLQPFWEALIEFLDDHGGADQ